VRAGLLALLFVLAAPTGAQADDDDDATSQPAPSRRPPGLSYGGTVTATLAPDLNMKGPYEDRFEARAGVDFRVAYKFAPNARFQISARGRYQLRVGDRVEADFFADLGDTWFQIRTGKMTVRAGLETMKWGQNTLLSVLDRLNPTDFTMALGGAGLDDPKIPLPAVRATFNLAPVAVELLYIPFFRPQRAALYGRDFAAMRPGMLEETLPGLLPSTSSGVVNQQIEGVGERLVEALVATDAYARDGIGSYLIADLPEEFPWHGDFGARLGATGRGFDVNGYFLWHVEDRPAVTLHDGIRRPLLQSRLPNSNELTQLTNPGAELVSTSYKRAISTGADIAVVAGDFVISGEAGFFTNTVHYRKTLEPYRSPMVRYSIELRYTFASTFSLTVGAEHDIIVTPAADTLLERQHNVSVVLLAILRVLRERVQIMASGSYNPVWQDLYVHPRVTIELQDRVTAVFGLQLFESFRPDAENSLDGFLAYRGGPLGYFRANDYGYGMVKVAF
jgi:hypothetical protein